jgi:hypothetical protein
MRLLRMRLLPGRPMVPGSDDTPARSVWLAPPAAH